MEDLSDSGSGGRQGRDTVSSLFSSIGGRDHEKSSLAIAELKAGIFRGQTAETNPERAAKSTCHVTAETVPAGRKVVGRT